jgi:hypothetical protein
MSTKATAGPFKGQPRGHQVFKFSPEGKVLMVLGKAGVRGNGPDTFDAPTGVAVAPNGDVYVTDGHGRNDRVVKFKVACATVFPGSPADFGKFIVDETAKWAKVVKFRGRESRLTG